jgi:hypothetical protein
MTSAARRAAMTISRIRRRPDPRGVSGAGLYLASVVAVPHR